MNTNCLLPKNEPSFASWQHLLTFPDKGIKKGMISLLSLASPFRKLTVTLWTLFKVMKGYEGGSTSYSFPGPVLRQLPTKIGKWNALSSLDSDCIKWTISHVRAPFLISLIFASFCVTLFYNERQCLFKFYICVSYSTSFLILWDLGNIELLFYWSLSFPSVSLGNRGSKKISINCWHSACAKLTYFFSMTRSIFVQIRYYTYLR